MSKNRQVGVLVHDIALLQKLTESQLKGVIEHDPLTYNSHRQDQEAIKIWQALGIQTSLIDQLLFSCAQQMIKQKKHGSAFDYLKMYDQRLGTHYALAYGVKVGSFFFVSTSDDVIGWQHFAKTAENALKNNDLDSAINCYGMVEKGSKVSVKGLNKVLRHALKCADIESVQRCTNLLDRELTQQELRLLRPHLVSEFKDRMSDQILFQAVTMYCTETEKRECLNYFAKNHSFGFRHLLEEYAQKWEIPITKKHLKFILSCYWYTSLNRGDAKMRVATLRKLVQISQRYELALKAALQSYRQYCIKYAEIVTASEIGDEIGQPVTILELTEFLRTWGTDGRYQKTHVPFAINRMVELIGPKPNPGSKEPDFGVHTFS